MAVPGLDHIVLRVPSLSAALATLGAAGFDIKEGGKHADGVTANALVVFADGVYLEAITFLTDGEGHPWWNKPNGLIDWAVAPPEGMTSEEVVDALTKQGVERYHGPRAGGRTTPSGQQCQWKVSLPTGERGQLPFFCEDLTPRDWRVVPRDSPHPNGATRVLRVTLLARASRFDALTSALSAALLPADLDSVSVTAPADHLAQHRSFWIRSPAGHKAEIRVSNPESEEQEKWVDEHGDSIYAVAIGINTPVGSAIVLEGGTRLVLTPLG